MSIVVGVLTIDLKAETASFSQAMDKASHLAARSANDIKRSLEKIAAVGLAMGAAIATGTAAMIEGALDAADEMGKMAERVGTTSETLSVLSFAAKTTGLETDKLGLGLTRLSVSAFKAQNGNVELQKIFGRLGVSVTDSNGKLKDSGLLMEELAVKFAGMGNSAGKTALAVAIFGKSGAALIPFMDAYGAKQEEINALAHRFGLELSTSTTQLAAQAKEKLDTLKQAATGFGFALLSSTLPALDKLASQLIKIAEDANIPDLGKAFGEKIVTTVTTLGNALEFAEKHAHALKIALEGLVALTALKIAIPVIADLQAGGIANVGRGLDKLTIGLFGLERTLPALKKLGAMAAGAGESVLGLAEREGIAGAATLLLGEAFAGPVGWIALAVTAITGLGVALYKARDATVSLKGSTFELRDAWNAVHTELDKEASDLDDDFAKHIHNIEDLWAKFTSGFSAAPIVQELKKLAVESDDIDAIGWALKGIVNKLTPQSAIDAVNRETKKREDATMIAPYLHLMGPAQQDPAKARPAPDTSGLGKTKEDPTSLLLANLAEKLSESQQVLAASGMEEEAQRKVAAQNKASNEIMKLGEEIAKQRGITTKDYASLVDAATQATIRSFNAQTSDNEARSKLNDILGNSSRQTALAIVQAGLMTAAMGQGSDAIARQSALTQAWNELRAKGASLTQILARAQQIYAQSTATENQSIAGTIIGLNQELVARQMVTQATLDGIDAQRDAALQAKLYAEKLTDPQIAIAPAGEIDSLLRKRDAIVAVTKAEWEQADAEKARSLIPPAEEYERSVATGGYGSDDLDKAVAALKELKALQGKPITYLEQLQIAAKSQEEFNKATDSTIDLLLKEGSMGDGVQAFFLKMQEASKTAAETIFDTLNETFSKLSDNLTQLLTAPNRWKRKDAENAFAGTFEGVGKNLLDSQIKGGMQAGLGALGKGIFGPDFKAPGGKPDGSRSNAWWVRWEGDKSPAGGAGSESGASSAPSTVLGAAALRIFGSGNELDRQLSGSSAIAQTPISGGNELDDQMGWAPAPIPAAQSEGAGFASGAARTASVVGSVTKGAPGPLGLAGGLLAQFGGLFSRNRATQQTGVLSGETLGLPTRLSPLPMPGRVSPLDTGPEPSDDTPLGAVSLPFAGQTSVLPAQSPGNNNYSIWNSGNELEDSNDSTGPAIAPAISQVPSALSRLATSAVLTGSLAVSPLPMAAQPTSQGVLAPPSNPVLQSIPTLLRRPDSGTSPATLGGENALDDLAMPSSSNASEGGLFNAPDVQPKPFTLITRPQPSELNQVLQGLIGAGSKIASSAFGGAGAASSARSAAGAVADTTGSVADDSADALSLLAFAGGGLFTGPVRGAGTGTSDSINARLSHGEFVTRAASAAKHLNLLHAINQDRLPRFADGGLFADYDGPLASPAAAYLPASSDFSAMSNRANQAAGNSPSSARVSSGDTHNWSIDARGSTDPAQVTAQLDRYMRTKAPQIAAVAVHAMKDGQLRRPPSAR